MFTFFKKRRVAAFLLLLLLCRSLEAHHGPGSSGGGVSTQSAEILTPGMFSVGLRLDFTEFKDFSSAEVQAKAQQGGEFDFIKRSRIETFALSYGVLRDWEVGTSIGYYNSLGSGSAEFDSLSSTVDTATQNPSGWTDLWLHTKYRFYQGPEGSFAALGSLKIPTGRSHAFNSAGEPVELADTPSSGAYDEMLGLAYTLPISSQLTMDASAQYIWRGEHQDFQVGNRFDLGLAFAYRLNEQAKDFPQVSFIGEAFFVNLQKNQEDGINNDNSGGSYLFLSPGFELRFSPSTTFTLSAPLPVVQNLHGEQLETSYKVVAGFSFTF